MTKEGKYIVTMTGERVNDGLTKFKSKKEAVDYMKRNYKFMVNMEVSIFSLMKEDNGMLEGIQTKYTINNF